MATEQEIIDHLATGTPGALQQHDRHPGQSIFDTARFFDMHEDDVLAIYHENREAVQSAWRARDDVPAAGGAGVGVNGRIFYVKEDSGSQSQEIWSAEADGSDPLLVIPHLLGVANGQQYYAPFLSPDGTKLAFMGLDTDGPTNYQVWIADPDGSNPTQLTNNTTWPGGAYMANGPWSPDSQRLCFTHSDYNAIWTMKADGSDQRAVFDGPCQLAEDPCYDNDGNILFGYTAVGGSDVTIAKVSAAGAVIDLAFIDPAASFVDYQQVSRLDGKIVMGDFGGTIFFFDAAGAPLSVAWDTTDPHYNIPGWSPDGTKVLLDHAPNENTKFSIIDYATGVFTYFVPSDFVPGVDFMRQPAWGALAA